MLTDNIMKTLFRSLAIRVLLPMHASAIGCKIGSPRVGYRMKIDMAHKASNVPTEIAAGPFRVIAQSSLEPVGDNR